MSFYRDVLMKDARFHSTDVCKDTALLEPGMRAAFAKFEVIAATLGHKVVVTETYRSPARQKFLFDQHKTELEHVGDHGFGVAVDAMIMTASGRLDPNGSDYEFYRHVARQVGLISGRDWGHGTEHGWQDSDHLQRVPAFRQPALFAGSWYPPVDYDPYADMKAHGVT